MGLRSWLCRVLCGGAEPPTVEPPLYAPSIYVVNRSTRVTDNQAAAMTRACEVQLRRDACPALFLLPSRVVFRRQPPDAARTIIIADDTQVDNALGWHTERRGDRVIGAVSAGTVLDNGGQVLHGALSVSTVLSHEVLELAYNSHVSRWADTGRGHLVASEVADPVQSGFYTIAVDGVDVAVSNFVTNEWFSPIATPGDRFDHLGVLTGPFEVADGGYVLTLADGRVEPVFGAGFPMWLYEHKTRSAVSRTSRLAHGRPS